MLCNCYFTLAHVYICMDISGNKLLTYLLTYNSFINEILNDINNGNTHHTHHIHA